MVPEAPLEQTEHGLMPAGRGWFVLSARDARWGDKAGRGKEAGLQGKGDFPQLGLGLTVLEPGEPMSMYHWETDQEDFLVLAGEGLLIVEGEERPLRQWDLVHCPPGTPHVIVGAGDGPCIVFAVGALENHTTGSRVDGTLEGRDDWGAYTVDEAALRHGAGVEEETTDADVAYSRFPELRLTRYRDGWLPS
jgi:quercetin dioxygenase-like cupin family protein